MTQNTYLFLIDYVKLLLEYPIINGLNMTFFILLWQGIGTFVILSLSKFTGLLQKKLNLEVDYFILILACLTGCFTAIYFIVIEDDAKVYGRAFRLIGIFGMVFLFLVSTTVILGAGIIIPIYSLIMWIVNGIINVLPVLAGFAVLVPILFFGGIFSIVAVIAGRL